LAYDGTAPTLLYGYGGFNVDVLPTFSPFNLLFMAHFKGVYASANIRGGA
jgi:prolyl oligopeptidase